MRDVLGNHLKDRLFHSVHWLNITLSLRRTSQKSINLERKSYLDCSSDTLCTRWEFGRVMYWLQTLRSWRRRTHRKSTRKDSMRKRWYFPKEKGDFIFPIVDGRINPLGGDQDLKTSTLIRQRLIRGESHLDFLGESERSLPPPHDSFSDAGEAMIIGSRDLSDPWTGFTQFTPLEEKPPDGYLWYGVRLTRKQLTSRPDHLWPELCEKMGKNAKLKERQKWSHEKTSTRYEEFISLTLRTRNSRRPSRMLARNWKQQWFPLCHARSARIIRIVGMVTCAPAVPSKLWRRIVVVVHPTKLKQNLRVFWKLMNLRDCVWEIQYRIIMKTMLQEKETIHYSITIWFINLFLCLKLWKPLQQKQQWKRNGKNWRKFRRGATVHFASLMDICHLKSAEFLEAHH